MIRSGIELADLASTRVSINGPASDDRTPWVLRAGEDRYRNLIRYMPTALWQVDTSAARRIFDGLRSDGVTDIADFLDAHPELVELVKEVVCVTEVNRAAVSLFRGQSATDLVKSVRYLFTAAPQMARRIIIAHFEGRRNYTEQTKILTLDGQTRDVIFSVTFPLPPEELNTSFITLLDVTERLRTEAQLRQLEADYAHAARISTLGELATSIAHEVKQPLAAIITNAETSLRWLTRDDVSVGKLEQLTTSIISCAHRANDIIQRIQSSAARGESERIVLDLKEVTAEALLFVRHEIDASRIDLYIDATAGLPKVLGDRVLLQQVIVNLLVNSIQAISQSEPLNRYIRLSIEWTDSGMLIFSIRDSGPGIAGADLEHVFDSFFTTKEGGLGIGLAICQSIISAHGGRISASNLSEGGAHFQFTLPTAPATLYYEDRIPISRAAQPGAAAAGATATAHPGVLLQQVEPAYRTPR